MTTEILTTETLTTETLTREIEPLAPAFTPGPANRLAMVTLASDETAPDELRRMIWQPDTVLHESRIYNSNTVNAETLKAMAEGITEAAGRLPSSAPYRAIGYLCTSASMLIGFDGIAERINAAQPGAAVTNPMQAGIRGAEALGAARIGLITPYIADVTDGLAARFEAGGLTVPRTASFFVDQDAMVAQISAGVLSDAAAKLAEGGGVDAVFLSCTALRTVDIIAGIEDRIGLPVLSSNQAVAWDMLRLAGMRPAPGRWGRLFG